ncbi:NlpC/P60 family protein [Sphingobium phage Lacusarx]|uniref:NlpC/P60 family protein n=1 Tax=Sphingobium phage Lacusarx TaxID=1980139 RepID=A0A1W6DXC5_9CAUD|nr:minor tail protein [Sphingobium phage Lacusarx]ARK07422.1 NlpC/P60 family protein [Sphingobium phage Lacusarx]
MQNPNADDVVAEARKWLGTRWVHQGRNEFGIDCAGLLVKVHEGLGLPVEDETNYRRTPTQTRFLEHIRNQTDYIDAPEPGAIAVFREQTFPCHTGFFAMKNGVLTIIHSYIVAKQVVEETFMHDWPRRLVEARRLRGVSY